jgi:hypothetical protein
LRNADREIFLTKADFGRQHADFAVATPLARRLDVFGSRILSSEVLQIRIVLQSRRNND